MSSYICCLDIDDEDLKFIAKALKGNKTITILEFKSKKISDEGAKSMLEILRKDCALSTVKFSSTKISKEMSNKIFNCTPIGLCVTGFKKVLKEVTNRFDGLSDYAQCFVLDSLLKCGRLLFSSWPYDVQNEGEYNRWGLFYEGGVGGVFSRVCCAKPVTNYKKPFACLFFSSNMMNRLHKQYLIDNRQKSPELQRAYDKNFGLALCSHDIREHKKVWGLQSK